MTSIIVEKGMSSFKLFYIIMKLVTTFMKKVKKADPKFVMLIGIIITLAVLLAKEKGHTCDCPVCKECEFEKKKVTFEESNDFLGVGPTA